MSNTHARFRGFDRPARGARRRFAPLAVAVLILAVPAAAEARVVVAPRDGADRAGPTKVVVKVGRGSVRARLNGERVDRQFLRISPSRRAVRVGAAQGLKRGRNVLKVKRITPRSTIRRRVVFRVHSRAEPAGIVAHGHHVAGAPLRLRAIGAGGRSWCLLNAPRRSSLREGRCSGAEKAKVGEAADRRVPPSGFADRHARRTSFTPDVPGRYRFALEVGSGPGASRDIYTVAAAQPAPLVPIDIPTANFEGEVDAGIVVGDATYAVGPSSVEAQPQLQIVVLDRMTLTLRSNKTYACAVAATCDSGIAGEVSADLAPLLDDSLVLVSPLNFINPYGDANNSMGLQTLKALAAIGLDPSVPFPAAQDNELPVFAAAGIPTMKPGEADVLRDTSSLDDLESAPHLSGVVTQDQNDAYRAVPTDYIDLTVRSTTTTTSNTMVIGDHEEAGALPAGAAGGFQAVVLDGVTGAVQADEVIVTNPASSSNVQPAINALNASIAADDPGVVLVASLGSPADQAAQIPGDYTALANWIQSHGGTADAVLSMKPGQTYAMAGATDSGPARGIEAGPMLAQPGGTPGPASGALAGGLMRDDDWRLAPGVSEVTDPSLDMMQTLYQPLTPWPDFDPDAMAYIAGHADPTKLGTDVRQAYWVQSYDDTEWAELRGEIKAVDYPGGSPGFSEADFDSLQAELATEIGWLISSEDYLGDLQTPFSNQGLSAWLDVSTIAKQIEAGLAPPPQSAIDVWAEGLAPKLDDMITEAATALEPEGAPLFSKLNSALHGAQKIASTFQSGSPSDSGFQTTVANFGTDLVYRLQAMQSSYDRMADIVVSDYGKLKTFGTLGGCDPGSAGCPEDWQWTQAEQTQASLGLSLWARRQTWEALLPAKLGASAWFGQYAPGEGSGYDAAPYSCQTGTGRWEHGYHPFAGMPTGGQAVLLSAMGADGPHHDLWAVASWSSSGVNDGDSATVPDASLVNPLFSAADAGGDPFSGGLGFVPSHFLWQTYPQPFNVLSNVVACGWP